MTTVTTQSVVILGGGPAGLTAAYRLTRLGYRVTIIDRRPLLGGARISEDLGDIPEPFTILGCHHEAEILLEFRLHDGSLIHYPRTSLPAPLHTWMNLLRFTGIPWKERWRLTSWV